MDHLVELDVKDLILSNGSFGPREIHELTGWIASNHTQFKVLKQAVEELKSQGTLTPASSVRLGVGLHLLGRFQEAAQVLANADGGALAYFYLGKSNFELQRFDVAISNYQSAKTGGYNADICALAVAESQRRSGEPETALATLDALSGAVEQTAEYLYQRACTVAAMNGSRSEVIALLERAVEVDGTHPGVLFGLALENDRQGNDGIALEYYRKAAACFPAHRGSLLNLGIMYEDNQQYELAQDATVVFWTSTRMMNGPSCS